MMEYDYFSGGVVAMMVLCGDVPWTSWTGRAISESVMTSKNDAALRRVPLIIVSFLWTSFIIINYTNYMFVLSFYSFIRQMTMEVQDYEYYEARVDDVNLEDITSSHYNANILASLRANDPELTYISITTSRNNEAHFAVREGDHLGWLGYFIGRSEKLERICIDNTPENDVNLNAPNVNLNDINLNEFYEGLGHNRSIRHLYICNDLGESFKGLIPFLRNNDTLRNLTFLGFDIGPQCARNVALLLGQRSSLKYLDFIADDLDDEGILQIVIALRSQPQIEELALQSNNIGRDGCVALGNTLESFSSLKYFYLRKSGHDDENVSNEGLNALVAGLKHCHNLTSLSLNGIQMITEAGLMSLSALFQSDNCRLEHLRLSQMNIGDDGMAVLVTGLASLASLKRLNLESMSIGEQGLQALVGALVDCNLEELDLSKNELTESVSGLGALGTFVRRETSMHSLSLRDCSLTDEGLRSFVDAMTNCCSLTKLCLSFNPSITTNALASLSSLLRAEHCCLCTLDLCCINIGDDGAAILAKGLIENKSLTTLRLTHFRNNVSGITWRGWFAFFRLLCDTSSVNNTYLSNHTLAQIGCCIGDRMYDTPRYIVKLLKWNELHNQAAAICKILHSHPDIDVTPLFQWEMKFLPLVVAWFENAKSYLDKVNQSFETFQCRQLSAVYKFIRGMPQLAADGYRREKKTKDIQSDEKKKSLT